MTKSNKLITAVLIIFFCLGNTKNANAQIIPVDSLETREPHQYLLPIFGNKIRAKGYKIPASAGVNINYFWQKSDIVVDNVNVGFNNGRLLDVEEYIQFHDTSSESNFVNFRPDFWLFPFLNIYGVFNQGTSVTNIKTSIVVPKVNEAGYTTIMDLDVSPKFDVTATGIGINPVIGGKYWFASFNLTFTWADISSTDDAIFSTVFNPRVGTHFNFKKEDRSLALWVGGFRLALENNTEGTIPMSSIADFSNFQNRLDTGVTRLEQADENLQDWWQGLTPLQQANPVNVKKYEVGTTVINGVSEFLESASTATGSAQDSTIRYKLDKRQKNKWNFMIGAQFQLNQHFNFRSEYGFLGTRQHFLLGAEYRFNL